jgi:hypothetical protein
VTSPGVIERCGLSVPDLSFDLPQQIRDLLRPLSLHRHDRSSSREFCFVSPGTKIPGQVTVLAYLAPAFRRASA